MLAFVEEQLYRGDTGDNVCDVGTVGSIHAILGYHLILLGLAQTSLATVASGLYDPWVPGFQMWLESLEGAYLQGLGLGVTGAYPMIHIGRERRELIIGDQPVALG